MPARSGRATLTLRVVASGLDQPIHVAAPRSQPGRLYVVEKAGRIRVLQDGRLLAQPFLDIRNLVGSSGGEQGLFSVAFHPRYAQNHRFYVDYTDTHGDTRVVEYRSDGTHALPDSRRELLFVDQPFSNHNGGQLAFAPSGRLWVGMGDGGAAGDPYGNAQNLHSRLGKLLALDVNAADPKPRIVALGLRNPWRFSFDRRTRDLYVGDVGQGSWEEIDYVRRASLGRLKNFGWDVYEGRASYERKARNPAGALVRPIAVYSHSAGSCSVTGGFVYRGSAVPSARGRYFYGDYCSGIVWSLRVVRGKARGLRREPFRVETLSSLGEDARGELYFAALSGRIYRLAR
jgi:glucose/arabinose dehydrogenase